MPYDGGGFYGQVGGNLPWGSGGSSFTFSNNPQALSQSYGQSYNDALAMNKANYGNILSGYQSALSSQQAAQGSLGKGWGDLQNRVMGLLDTQGQSQSQAIMDQYAAQLGGMNQQLINRGLGNTTVTSSVARGNILDRTKALNQNNEQVAALKANYMRDIGSQSLMEQERAYQNNTGLLGKQFDWMNSVNAKYPDAGLYAELARSGQNRGPSSVSGSGMGGGGGGVPGLGYSPRPGPGYYDGGSSLLGSGGGGGGGFGSWAGSPISAGYSSPYAVSDSGFDGWSGGFGDTGDYYGGGGDY